MPFWQSIHVYINESSFQGLLDDVLIMMLNVLVCMLLEISSMDECVESERCAMQNSHWLYKILITLLPCQSFICDFCRMILCFKNTIFTVFQFYSLIFAWQPMGFCCGQDLVLSLSKAMYGLWQAPHYFFKHPKSKLEHC